MTTEPRSIEEIREAAQDVILARGRGYTGGIAVVLDAIDELEALRAEGKGLREASKAAAGYEKRNRIVFPHQWTIATLESVITGYQKHIQDLRAALRVSEAAE